MQGASYIYKYILAPCTKSTNHYWQYTGKKWGNAENYDLVINRSQISINHTIEILPKIFAK